MFKKHGKPSYCFLNVALHVNVSTENVKKAEGQWSNRGDMETQRATTQARESLRERREGKNCPSAQNYSGEKQAQQTHIDNGRWHIKAS